LQRCADESIDRSALARALPRIHMRPWCIPPRAAHDVGAGRLECSGRDDYNVARRLGPSLQTSSFLASLSLLYTSTSFNNEGSDLI
jgi:hypothetical protein